MVRKRAMYIVSEQSCLDPFTGAGKHIETGLKQLSNFFDISLVLFCKPPEMQSDSGKPVMRRRIIHERGSLKEYLKKIVRWWYIIFQNHKRFWTFYRTVKKARPEFIYERAGYLNFNGLLIARLLRIRHFYEVNGLYFQDNAFRFLGINNTISKFLEKAAYRKTTCFFVGGLNTELGIQDSKNAISVQNGIDRAMIDSIVNSTMETKSLLRPLNILFVGHAMSHHRLDVLLAAIEQMKKKDKVILHFVGSNFESFFHQDDVLNFKIVEHGVLSHQEMLPILESMDVGIVPFALPYYSNMKVFLYAAAGLKVIIPEVRNFLNIFTQDEVIFFRNGDSVALANALDNLVDDFSSYFGYGQRIRKKVDQEFSWEEIFKKIAFRMCGS